MKSKFSISNLAIAVASFTTIIGIFWNLGFWSIFEFNIFQYLDFSSLFKFILYPVLNRSFLMITIFVLSFLLTISMFFAFKNLPGNPFQGEPIDLKFYDFGVFKNYFVVASYPGIIGSFLILLWRARFINLSVTLIAISLGLLFPLSRISKSFIKDDLGRIFLSISIFSSIAIMFVLGRTSAIRIEDRLIYSRISDIRTTDTLIRKRLISKPILHASNEQLFLLDDNNAILIIPTAKIDYYSISNCVVDSNLKEWRKRPFFNR